MRRQHVTLAAAELPSARHAAIVGKGELRLVHVLLTGDDHVVWTAVARHNVAASIDSAMMGRDEHMRTREPIQRVLTRCA